MSSLDPNEPRAAKGKAVKSAEVAHDAEVNRLPNLQQTTHPL